MAKKSVRTDRDLNRVTLHRIHRIFERIRTGSFPNRRRLALEIETSEKTIFRDIQFMQEFMNLPIAYDPLRYGYYFTEEVGSFPLLKLAEGELFAIFVAEKALEQYVGTPFEQPLRNTFQKFTAGLSGELSFQWSELQEAVSFRSIDVNPLDAKILQELMLAIRQRREITFDYKKPEEAKYKRRHAQPYELVSHDRQWYLITFDLDRNALRTFMPCRMRKLSVTSKVFVKPQGFSAAKHLQNSFGIFSGGIPKTVRIEFDRFAAQLIRERQWHPSQRIQERNGGRLELSLALGSFEEVQRWILSWGFHARVLEPSELIASVKEAISKVQQHYARVDRAPR